MGDATLPGFNLALIHTIKQAGLGVYVHRSLQRELLEAVLAGLTYGTYLGGALPRGQVTADLAAPYREAFLALYGVLASRGLPLGLQLLELLGLGPSLRYLPLYLLLAFQDLLGYVKSSVTLVVLFQVGIAVIAGTDDVQILLPLPLTHTTGA